MSSTSVYSWQRCGDTRVVEAGDRYHLVSAEIDNRPVVRQPHFVMMGVPRAGTSTAAADTAEYRSRWQGART